MSNLLFIWAQLYLAIAHPQLKCGDSIPMNRPYGKVMMIVDCESIKDNNISVLELKGDTLHGISIHYDSLWRKMDSCQYRNDLKEGRLVFWDTTGKPRGHRQFKKGVETGRAEFNFPDGKPQMITNYKSGEVHGVWKEWWPNGKLKFENVFDRDVPVRSTEYYPSGQMRVRFRARHIVKKNPTDHLHLYSEYETWAPDGRPAGKVTKGQGEVMQLNFKDRHFDAGWENIVFKDATVFREEPVDSVRAYRWIDSLSKVQGPK